MADDATYMIRSGVGALERLELIARLCAPATLAFLTRTGALGAPRFLDVGCGIGDVAVRAAAAGATPRSWPVPRRGPPGSARRPGT
jgi:2-polyprenyl-3-methyl-5-hydroxy-6-metoxy-1,4-benzoquinol methylase